RSQRSARFGSQYQDHASRRHGPRATLPGTRDGEARVTEYRNGLGWDVHRIAPGRPLILGGITIPSDFGLEGHSDADVLAHAITDAILGAAALGHIGMHFPDSDQRWKGCDSLVFLRHAHDLAKRQGYRI